MPCSVPAIAPRVLTQRHLNRALLARQLLLERGRGSLPKTLDRIGGIQAQYAPSAYVGLWSRLEGFERDQLTRALERRTVVQGTLMRVTIHLVSAANYWRYAEGIRAARRRALLRVRKEVGGERDFEVLMKPLRKQMAGATLSQREIRELIGERAGFSASNWLDLVRAPPSGTWERRRADLYASAEYWLGTDGVGVDTADSVDFLVRSYLGGFGPAGRKDIADWAGLPVREVMASLERLELRRFEDEQGNELVDLPRAPLPDPDTPAPVRFIPTWDAITLANLRRTGVLPEQYRPLLFSTKNPHSMSTFLVDGAVAGSWKFENDRIALDPFEKLDRQARRELDAEAERLAEFHR